MFGVSSLASGKERNILSMLSMLANTPWFQFNPLRLMNANKGVFGVNVGHMWDEIDRLRGWGEALMELAARGIVRPKVAASFKFDDAPKAHSSKIDATSARCSLSPKGAKRGSPNCARMTWVAVTMKAKLTFLGRGQNGAIDP
jgi:hypothetical protein